MESSTSSFDGIIEDLLSIPVEELQEAVDAYIHRFPHHRERLRKFATDALMVGRYFSAAKDDETDESSSTTLGRIGRFQPINEIGRGSQGIVYKAEQIGIARTVALKVIREGVLASAKERMRFENEIQLISRLKHPNIVTVYDCGIEAGRAYFAMEYIEGKRVDEAIKESTWPVADIVQLFLQVADAVSYAHQHGIIHRDLKPSNILVDAHRQAHILDFGLAKAINDRNAPAVTEFGIFTGTWPYASPEQVDTGESVTDVRSDVYTLGIILFQLLTDTFPYAIEADTRITRENILKTPPRRPSFFRPEVTDDLDTIVLRALAKEADRRYQSAAAFRDDVQRYLRNEAIEAKRDSRLYVLKKTIENYRWQFRAAAAGMLALVAFAVAITWLYADARQARATIEARAKVVRAGQRYTTERLRDLQVTANVMEEYRREQPASLLLGRLEKQEMKFPVEQVQALGEFPQADPAALTLLDREWLRDKDSALESLVRDAEQFRFRFVSNEADSPWLMDHRPEGLVEAKNLCRVLAARTWAKAAQGNADQEALRSLSAARSIALDLADESSYLYKGASLACRLVIYQTMQGVIAEACNDPARLSARRKWLEEDPALPSLKYIRLFERSKALQYLEGSVEGVPSSGEARLSLQSLNRLSGGLYEQVGLLSPGAKHPAISLERVVAALDEFAQSGAIRSAVDKDAIRLVWPLLPDLSGCESLRQASFDAKQRAQDTLEGCFAHAAGRT